jgi:hypothetical protein
MNKKVKYEEKDLLQTFIGLKKGTKIITVRNTCNHNYPQDVILTLNRPGNDYRMEDCVDERKGRNYLYAQDCILYKEPCSENAIASMQKEHDDLIKKAEDLTKKIKICNDLCIDEYDEELIDIYTIMVNNTDETKISSAMKIVKYYKSKEKK